MTRLHVLVLCLLFSLGTLTGCAGTLKTSPLPQGVTVQHVAKMDAASPLAVNAEGTIAAVFEGKLRLMDASNRPPKDIAATPAIALGFSPTGDRLAAAFVSGRDTMLRILDLQGRTLHEATVPGRVTALSWYSDREVMASALVIKRFSFGAELASSFFRWDLKNAPSSTLLFNVTVRPQVGKLPEEALYRSLNFAISPYGDEIAYSAIKDPPLFTPYLRIALRHLDTGAEKVVAELPVGSGGPAYSADGLSLLVGSEGGLTRRITVPEAKEVDAWPTPGDRIKVSPFGSYLLIDGRLYQGGHEVFAVPGKADALFIPDGSGLVVGNNGGVFLVSGLNEQPRPAPLPKDLGRVLELRRLHLQGLISDAEFKKRLKQVSAQ